MNELFKIVTWTRTFRWLCTGRMRLPIQTDSARAGATMALASMFCVQLGIAVSVGLFDQVGPEGTAWLRLTFGAILLVAVIRPWRASFTRSSLLACLVLGVATGGVTLLFIASVARLPLGTASALEFLGPLGVAVARGRGSAKLWSVLAAAGVVLLTEPWRGDVDLVGVGFALAAAACWATYILLTQRVGDEVTGLNGLAVSLSVAALVATIVVGPSVTDLMTWQLVIIGFGLSILLPVVPFSLELLALRRLTTAAFGTLMALEPAFALLIGLAVLHQIPGPSAVLGIVLVVTAGVGAERTGARHLHAPVHEAAPAPSRELEPARLVPFEAG
jgi:inner membrane transporter RhtA